MLETFDIIRLASDKIQLRAGGEAFQLDFDTDTEEEIFKMLIDFEGRSYRKLIKRLLAKYDRAEVLKFFQSLKDSGIIYFESDGLLKGKIYDLDIDEYNGDRLKDHSIGLIIENEDSQLYKYLIQSGIKKQLTVIKSGKLKTNRAIEKFIVTKSIVIVDGIQWNPSFLTRFNKVAVKQEIPWLYVEGIIRGKGFLGPLFIGRETGCYNCFISRVKSNLDFVDSFVQYEKHLREYHRSGKPSRADQAFVNVIGAMVVTEVKKFLLDIGFPHSYGSLITIDFDCYETSIDPLHKLPFCPECEDRQHHRVAPWLDEITLHRNKVEA